MSKPPIDLNDPSIEACKSTCFFCHTNCGTIAYVKDGEVIRVEGDPDHSTNRGGLCSRGNIALKHLDHPDRINTPLKRKGEKGAGQWEEITWEQALDEIAERLKVIREESGAEALATCGGTVRTDDWARRRFMNLFGSPNSFHNALLCWIPTFMIETAVSGWSPFGADLDNARIAVLWGANPGASVLPTMRTLTDCQKKGMKLMVIDPRYTATAAHADLWVPLRPGSDLALALAWLNVIIGEYLYDEDFCRDYCTGFDELAEHVKQYTPQWAAPLTDLTPTQIRESARMYAKNKPGSIMWGTSMDQQGRASGAAIHARALIRAIMGNINVTGGDIQTGPGLEFMVDEEFECNDVLSEEQRAKQLGSDKYKLCTWPGYGLIRDIALDTWGAAPPSEWMCEANAPSVWRAILEGEPYRVRALICCATNPVNSYGDSKVVLEALKKVEFLVTCEYWMTSAALYADYVMPIAGALERPVIHNNYGCATVFHGGRRAISPLHDRGTDFQFWRGLGLRLGQDDEEDWPWECEEEAYFDIVYPTGLEIESYDEFVDEIGGSYSSDFNPNAWREEGFPTRSGKVELKSSVLEELGYPGLPTYVGAPEAHAEDPEVVESFPLILTTGGGFMPFHHSEEFNIKELRFLRPDPYFDINPETAQKLGIKKKDWCWIETMRGRIKQRACLTNGIAPNTIYTQRGWWYPERTLTPGEDDPFGVLESNTNVLTAASFEDCDPISGTWACRGLRCRVYKVQEGGAR